MIIIIGKVMADTYNIASIVFCHMHSVQQSSSVPDPTYELVAKPDNDDDVNMEKNPAYSVQDTSMLHHYDFVSDTNQTTTKQ